MGSDGAVLRLGYGCDLKMIHVLKFIELYIKRI